MQLITGIALSAVGLVTTVAGIGIGFAAKANHGDSEEFCDEQFCDPDGLQIRRDARALGTIGTAAFVGGAVVLGGGLLIGLTSPTVTSGFAGGKQTWRVAVAPTLGGASVAVGGAW